MSETIAPEQSTIIATTQPQEVEPAEITPSPEWSDSQLGVYASNEIQRGMGFARQTVLCFWRAGKALRVVKERFKGNYLDWLEAQGIPFDRANDAVKLAKRFTLEEVEHLTVAQARKLVSPKKPKVKPTEAKVIPNDKPAQKTATETAVEPAIETAAAVDTANAVAVDTPIVTAEAVEPAQVVEEQPQEPDTTTAPKPAKNPGRFTIVVPQSDPDDEDDGFDLAFDVRRYGLNLGYRLGELDSIRIAALAGEAAHMAVARAVCVGWSRGKEVPSLDPLVLCVLAQKCQNGDLENLEAFDAWAKRVRRDSRKVERFLKDASGLLEGFRRVK